jgi:peptidoglycan/LPS O-acetylase OafA/YrhL
MTKAAGMPIRGRASGLEALRGCAAFAILLFHLEALYFPLPPGALKSTVATFWCAVPLFFAISAYSLLYGYSSRIFDQQSLLRFYVRRVFRIVPLFYLMLLLYLIVRFIYGTRMSRG